MLSRVIVNIIRRSVCNNARILYCSRDPLHSDFLYNGNAKLQNHCNLYITKRFKSRKKAADIKKDEDSEEEDDDDDEEAPPVGSKVMKIKANSLRLDLVCKTAFKMSRNKVEEIFYDSRFRINGNKVLKKSKEVKVGDEIDVILHQSMDNPRLLVINRILILSVSPTEDETQVQIKLSVDKNLLIENYENSYTSV